MSWGCTTGKLTLISLLLLGLSNECHIEHHCLLLPQLTKSGLPAPGSEPYYVIVDSHWLDVALDPVIGKPIFIKPKINY